MAKIWRYKLDKSVSIYAPELVGTSFSNEFLSIKNCYMTVYSQYAWDGCSPAYPLYGGAWIGVPDGPLGIDGRPVSWRASLFHDALCQFGDEIIGLRKSATVKLFRRLLIEGGAPAWMYVLYPPAVSLFGPKFDKNEGELDVGRGSEGSA